jgi:hypothetical protein
MYFKNTYLTESGTLGLGTFSGAGGLYGEGKFIFGDTIIVDGGTLFYGDK